MKKIKADINQKDRVICVSELGCHKFFFQPVRSKDRIWLFDTNYFSGSVFAYFRDRGRNMNGRGFSLTIQELYEFKEYGNIRLSRVINRIPMMVDYTLREKQIKENATNTRVSETRGKILCVPDEINVVTAA